MTRIVVDAMGSDNFPTPDVEGSVMAAREYGVEIILVGDEARLRPALEAAQPGSLSIRIVHAPSQAPYAQSQNAKGDNSASGKVVPPLSFDTPGMQEEAVQRSESRLLRQRGSTALADISIQPGIGPERYEGREARTRVLPVFSLERATGFEPATLGLGSRCSAS